MSKSEKQSDLCQDQGHASGPESWSVDKASATSSPVLRIREAKEDEDWPFVENLYKEAAHITHPEYGDERIDQHVAERKKRWFAAGAYALIAEQLGIKLGTIWVVSDTHKGAADFIQLIAVNPSFRRRKIATALLIEAIARSRCRKCRLLRAGMKDDLKVS